MSGKAVGQAVNQIAAFRQGLAGKAAEEIGDPLEFADKAGAVVLLDQVGQPPVVGKKVQKKTAALFAGKHDVGIQLGALGKYPPDRKSTRLNSSHVAISYAVFCLK